MSEGRSSPEKSEELLINPVGRSVVSVACQPWSTPSIMSLSAAYCPSSIMSPHPIMPPCRFVSRARTPPAQGWIPASCRSFPSRVFYASATHTFVCFSLFAMRSFVALSTLMYFVLYVEKDLVRFTRTRSFP